MSTDKRGKSRTNRLIAVPPLRAKQRSFATSGNTSSKSTTCGRYGLSSGSTEWLRDGDREAHIQPSAARHLPFALSKRDTVDLHFATPGRILARHEKEKQAFHFDAGASFQQLLHQRGPEGRQSFK